MSIVDRTPSPWRSRQCEAGDHTNCFTGHDELGPRRECACACHRKRQEESAPDLLEALEGICLSLDLRGGDMIASAERVKVKYGGAVAVKYLEARKAITGAKGD